MYEIAYSESLTAVAMGATRDETRQGLHETYPSLPGETIQRAMADALTDAMKQGVQREDIDDSWF